MFVTLYHKLSIWLMSEDNLWAKTKQYQWQVTKIPSLFLDMTKPKDHSFLYIYGALKNVFSLLLMFWPSRILLFKCKGTTYNTRYSFLLCTHHLQHYGSIELMHHRMYWSMHFMQSCMLKYDFQFFLHVYFWGALSCHEKNK